MATPKDAYPPLALKIDVEIDPKTPYAGAVAISTAQFRLVFVAKREELQQLHGRIVSELEKAPLPAGRRSKGK